MNSFPGTIAAFATAVDGKYAKKKFTILKKQIYRIFKHDCTSKLLQSSI